MPTYEYRCPSGHDFELIQKMSDEPGAKCPECGAESERRISGGAGFLFKGDGFYITDSRSDSYKKEASKESGVEAPAAGSEKKEAKAKETSSTSSPPEKTKKPPSSPKSPPAKGA